jgi:hypothetical protein
MRPVLQTYAFAAALLIASGPAFAHKPSAAECREGGDFIRNAALSRDNGTTRKFILDHLREDYVMIRAFRPEERWFVMDVDDEESLQAEVELVFDAPLPVEQHRVDFLERCARRPAGL